MSGGTPLMVAVQKGWPSFGWLVVLSAARQARTSPMTGSWLTGSGDTQQNPGVVGEKTPSPSN